MKSLLTALCRSPPSSASPAPLRPTSSRPSSSTSAASSTSRSTKASTTASRSSRPRPRSSYAEFEVTNETQFEQAHRRFAQRGQDPIVGVGFTQANPVEKVAKEFPKIRFTIIDGVVKLPNVQSVLFKEHEGSFLVGVLAALASKTGKVGFVGGMDIPLIRRFACGYEQGVKYANPKAEVIQNMTGTTPAAWNDPARGGELAKGQFDRGVDVIYAAAGAHRQRRATGREGPRQARDRRRLQPEPPASRHDADLDGQARRPRDL